jgi:hypothetical protein
MAEDEDTAIAQEIVTKDESEKTGGEEIRECEKMWTYWGSPAQSHRIDCKWAGNDHETDKKILISVPVQELR